MLINETVCTFCKYFLLKQQLFQRITTCSKCHPVLLVYYWTLLTLKPNIFTLTVKPNIFRFFHLHTMQFIKQHKSPHFHIIGVDQRAFISMLLLLTTIFTYLLYFYFFGCAFQVNCRQFVKN